jgi:hypothetical protein
VLALGVAVVSFFAIERPGAATSPVHARLGVGASGFEASF